VRPGRQHHEPLPKHDAVGVTERPATVMGGLVEVRDGGLDAELRPELSQHSVARQPVALRERQELDEIPRPSVRPCACRQGLAVDTNVEPTQQQKLDALHLA
jgi:hypothetical protein